MSSNSEATPLKTWDYRVITEGDSDDRIFYIAVVFYQDGKVVSKVEVEDIDYKNSIKDLKDAVNQAESTEFAEAFDKPVLDEDTNLDWVEEKPDDEHIHANKIIKIGEYDLKNFLQPMEVAGEKSFFLSCPNCGKNHFRHAGYMITVTPFLSKDEGAKISESEERVLICVSCLHSIILLRGKIVDVTDEVDLEAWKKAEAKATEATGPGMIGNGGTAGC